MLKDVSAEVFITGKIREMVIDIFCIDANSSADDSVVVSALKGDLFQKTLHDGMQTASTNIFGTFIDLPGYFCDPSNAIGSKI